MRRRLPAAVLHVFGGGPNLDGLDGVARHPSPADSRTAFPDGAVVVIPERHPTGVPMKALEAWARGLPLIVDGPTAEILDAGDGDDEQRMAALDSERSAARQGARASSRRTGVAA